MQYISCIAHGRYPCQGLTHVWCIAGIHASVGLMYCAWQLGQEARIVQFDLSAAFDNVNHQRILFKLCSVGVGGSVLSVLTQFLSGRSQYFVVDGCRSKLVDAVSGVPLGSVLGQQLFLL